MKFAELKQNIEGEPLIELADVMDMNEILIVRSENERRAYAAANRKT